jgi:hypothetical protein
MNEERSKTTQGEDGRESDVLALLKTAKKKSCGFR